MKVYVDNTQPQLQQNTLRNLLKSVTTGRNKQREMLNSPSAIRNAFNPRDIFVPNSKFNNITQEEHIANNPLIKDAVTIGGIDYEVSKEEAYERLTSPLYSMDENVAPENMITYHDKAGLSFEADFSYAGLRAGEFDADDFRKNVDYIASSYVVLRERIHAEFTGEERTAN